MNRHNNNQHNNKKCKGEKGKRARNSTRTKHLDENKIMTQIKDPVQSLFAQHMLKRPKQKEKLTWYDVFFSINFKHKENKKNLKKSRTRTSTIEHDPKRMITVKRQQGQRQKAKKPN